jgi:dCMP deaminase
MHDRRPGWDLYFLNLADAVSVRADCTRRKVGAVLVDPVTHDLIQTGYNGAPSGEPGCLSAGACPRGRHYELRDSYLTRSSACACGQLWPCPDAVAPGSSYDTGPGKCISIHAELNCLLRAGLSARNATMYITDEPCEGCWKSIRGAGVTRVVWWDSSWQKEEEHGGHRLRKFVQRVRRT